MQKNDINKIEKLKQIITNHDYKNFIDVIEISSINDKQNFLDIETKNYLGQIIKDRLNSYKDLSFIKFKTPSIDLQKETLFT